MKYTVCVPQVHIDIVKSHTCTLNTNPTPIYIYMFCTNRCGEQSINSWRILTHLNIREKMTSKQYPCQPKIVNLKYRFENSLSINVIQLTVVPGKY